MFRFLATSAFVAFIVVEQVKADCVDTLSSDNTIDVKDADGNVVYTATSCSDLFERYPGTCQSKKVGGMKGSCCATCGDPKCLDKVTEWVPFPISGMDMTSCSDIINDYKVFCKNKKVGKKRGVCCRSCKGVDTKCVDKAVKFSGETCAERVQRYPCSCDDRKFRKTCCESCKDTDISGCGCRDKLSESSFVTVRINDPDRNPIVQKNVTNCGEIVKYYAQFCQQLGGTGKHCCQSCDGVDPTCKDNLLWKGTVSRGSNACTECNCHEIRQKSRFLMQKACKNDIKGIGTSTTAQEACCLQCSKFK